MTQIGKKTYKQFIYTVFSLSLPLAVQRVINLTVSLIDNIMVGRLGENAMSAVGICNTYLWFLDAVILGISSGAMIICAQDWGAGDRSRIKRLFSLAMTYSLTAALVFYTLTSLFSEQIIRIYSNIPELVAPGSAYLLHVRYGFLFLAVSQTIVIILQAVREVRIGLINSILSCIFNVFFNWVFIFGHLGFPAMGVAGAALGTAVARGIEALISVVYLLMIEKKIRFRLTDFNPFVTKELHVKYWTVTLPILGMSFMQNLLNSSQTMITGRVSKYYMAAQQIVHMAWMIPNAFGGGMSNSASIIIGNDIGAGDLDEVHKDSWRFVRTALIFAFICSGLIQVLLPILMKFYTISEETQILTRQMGWSASITVLFLVTSSTVNNGVIRAGGDTRRLFIVDMISNWLITIPFGILAAFVLKWPAPILYIILRSGNLFKAIWGVNRLRGSDWIRKLTDAGQHA